MKVSYHTGKAQSNRVLTTLGKDGLMPGCKTTGMVTKKAKKSHARPSAFGGGKAQPMTGKRLKDQPLRRIYLKEWLDHLHVKQVTLASLTGQSEKTISTWIKEPWRINLDVISAIADALSAYSPALRDAGNLFRHPDTVQSFEQAREAAKHLLDTLPEGEPP